MNISLTEKDIAFYRENGFWVAPKLFSEEELEEFRSHFYQILEGKYETGIAPAGRNSEPNEIQKGIVKITNCLWSDSKLSQLILNQDVGKLASSLSGHNTIRYWRDHLWYKPPDTGSKGNVGWHQDYFYWQSAEPAEIITAWVALDDVTEDSGCLEFVPGSHKWGLYQEGNLYEQDSEKLQKQLEKATGRNFDSVTCPMVAGAVSFHNCLTFHGSHENQSPRPRLSFSIRMFGEGLRYRAGHSIKPFSNEQLLSGKDGELFRGPHFPVIYRAGQISNPWEIDTNLV